MMSVATGKVRILFHAMREGGLSQVRRVVNTHLLTRETRRLEAACGAELIEPATIDELELAGANGEHGFFYTATPVRCIRTLIESVPQPHERFTFLDFGSGKGAALLVAAEYPFRRVLGVEFGKELHEVACRNLAQPHAARVCEEVQSHWGDATEFPLPAEPLVVLMGNPFGEPVMRQVVANLGEAQRRHGQPMFVLYQQLRREDDISRADTEGVFRGAGFLEPRPVRFRTLRDRMLLSHLKLGVYEVAAR